MRGATTLASLGIQPHRRSSPHSLVPYAVGIAVSGFVLSVFNKGWLPHDDGYLAWAARETLRGGLPHLDFHEVYTGGLSFLNAGAFSVLGESLLSLRIAYLAFFAVFGVVLYLVVRRFLDSTFSAFVVGSLILLGPGLTATPMPTLYNLFFGTFSLYFAIRFVEDGRRVWLLPAGLVSGLSVLFKITGFYMLLAIALGLIAYHASRRANGLGAVSRVLIVLAGVVPTLMIVPELTLSRLVGLLGPIYVILWFIWSMKGSTTDVEPERETFASLGVFALSAALPIVAYIAGYVARGAFGNLIEGVVGTASTVIADLGFDLVHLQTLAVPLGFAGVCVLLVRISKNQGVRVVGAIACTAILLWYSVAPRNALLAIHGATRWITLLAFLLFVIVSRRPRSSADHRIETSLLMVAAAAACFQLVQFPSSNLWQVAYCVPLSGVLLFALLHRFGLKPLVVGVVMVSSFAVVFAFARFQGQIFSSPAEVGETVTFIPLSGDFAEIVIPDFNEAHNDIIAAVSQRSQSELLMAGPDAPEIYFLTGHRGSHPGVFPGLDGLVDPQYSMAAEFDETRPDMVVVIQDPPVSEPDERLLSRVRAECAHGKELGPFLFYVGCEG